jgi:hypothetical protein
MAARTTNADIVGVNDFAFANNLGHYRGQLAAKLAKHLVTHMATRRLDYPIEPMTLQICVRTASGRSQSSVINAGTRS